MIWTNAYTIIAINFIDKLKSTIEKCLHHKVAGKKIFQFKISKKTFCRESISINWLKLKKHSYVSKSAKFQNSYLTEQQFWMNRQQAHLLTNVYQKWDLLTSELIVQTTRTLLKNKRIECFIAFKQAKKFQNQLIYS